MTALWLLSAAALLGLPSGSRQVARRARLVRRARGQRPAGAGPLAPMASCAAGAACLVQVDPPAGIVLALVVTPLAWWGLRRLLRAEPRRDVALAELPLVLDLCAASLRAGRPPSDALAAAAPAAPEPVRAALDQVAGLIRLGAEPEQAWSVLSRDGPLGEVAAVAVRSATSGARLALAFERLAVEIRATLATTAETRAQRAGVVALAPLAACFLPSFIALGVVPVIVGMGRQVLDGGLL